MGKKSKYAVEFKIDRDIPFPFAWGRKSISAKYPIYEMQVGDSFVFRDNINKSEKYFEKCKNSVKTICGAWNRRIPNKKFNWEIQGDVMRVWRIQ